MSNDLLDELDREERLQQEAQRRQRYETGQAIVAARERELGRALSRTERSWLLRGVFRHRYGEALGDAMAEEVMSEHDRRSAELLGDETGVRPRKD